MHRIDVDVAQISRVDHKKLGDTVRALCPEAEVSEADYSADRSIDPQAIGIGAGCFAITGILLVAIVYHSLSHMYDGMHFRVNVKCCV